MSDLKDDAIVLRHDDTDSYQKSIVALGSEAYMKPDTQKMLESIPQDVRKDFISHIHEASFWKRVAEKSTPDDALKYRKGNKIPGTEDYQVLEYFKADYTINELNRLFPGWWQEEMVSHPFNKELLTIKQTGYLCVEIPTLTGKKVIRRWASASAELKKTKDLDKITGFYKPVNPDDLEKSADTEWLKRAGRLYGIGLDIYSQAITYGLRQEFEDLVRLWGVYAEEPIAIVKTITTGQGFRAYLRELPTKEQTLKFIELMQVFPIDMRVKDGLLHDITWKNFMKLKNNTQENKNITYKFLRMVETNGLKYQEQNKKEGA